MPKYTPPNRNISIGFYGANGNRNEGWYRFYATRTYNKIITITQSSFNILSRSVLTNRISTVSLVILSRSTRVYKSIRKTTIVLTPNAKTLRFKSVVRVTKTMAINIFNNARFLIKSRKAIVTQPVQAVVTRKINRGRLSKVTISYKIGATRRATLFRRAIATFVGVAKNIANRPFYISTIEQATETHTLVSVSETAANNVDIPNNFANESDILPNDYNEPAYPAGEDVVPT